MKDLYSEYLNKINSKEHIINESIGESIKQYLIKEFNSFINGLDNNNLQKNVKSMGLEKHLKEFNKQLENNPQFKKFIERSIKGTMAKGESEEKPNEDKKLPLVD